jgi:DNA primase
MINRFECLQKFSELVNSWLFKEEASSELSYLIKRVPKDKIQTFNFGYFPKSNSSIMEFVDQFGEIIKEDPYKALEQCGILFPSYRNKIAPFFKEHHLLIPFHDIYGRIASITSRTLLSEKQLKEKKISKYKHIPFEKRFHLYGLNLSHNNILTKNEVIITEGQFDMISAYCCGINNVVAVGGSKITFEQLALLKRLTNNFVIIFDNDEAGVSGYDKIKKSEMKHNINVSKKDIPRGYKDLDEFVRDNSTNVVDILN